MLAREEYKQRHVLDLAFPPDGTWSGRRIWSIVRTSAPNFIVQQPLRFWLEGCRVRILHEERVRKRQRANEERPQPQRVRDNVEVRTVVIREPVLAMPECMAPRSVGRGDGSGGELRGDSEHVGHLVRAILIGL